uniref:LEM domain-containing protein n=1 Tax=Periophthalmus magnuspinnatus TaxID=409849 RepID=A0A3B4A371_9GOBI
MANLSEKTADELRALLDEYGIKHGPIVESTRSLYEKKLREAMAKVKKSSSDKTYYREEDYVDEYVTFFFPLKVPTSMTCTFLYSIDKQCLFLCSIQL